MSQTAKKIWADVELIRKNRPLVLSVTNNVVTNFTANALLALGASPAMSHAPQDAAELAGYSGAVVLNMGTPAETYVQSMLTAGRQANLSGVPVIFDPVAAGATALRARVAEELMREVICSVIRGNASEIMALAKDAAKSKGVDSLNSVDEARLAANALAAKAGCVVCVSGEQDVVSGGRKGFELTGGNVMMTRVTGMGCAATALIAAFAAVNPDLLQATRNAMALMSLAGEMACAKSAGPGSLAVNFLDTLYNLDLPDIEPRLRVREI